MMSTPQIIAKSICLAAVMGVMVPGQEAFGLDATGRPVGGGILDAGLQGEYFPNPDLERRARVQAQ